MIIALTCVIILILIFIPIIKETKERIINATPTMKDENDEEKNFHKIMKKENFIKPNGNE